jgi:hypothetical protein
MTKQEFLSGKVFKLAKNTGSNTFQYGPATSSGCTGYIERNILSSDGERVILTDYEANVSKIGSKTFTVCTYVLDKKVQLKYRYDELI